MKKSITFIISSNSPNLLIVCLFKSSFILSFGTALIKSVCIGVGPIAFTVILKGLNSFEAVCVKVSMAALLEA